MLPDRREHLGLLDGVHTEIGLQVKIHIEQIRRITGQLGHDAHHGVGHPITGGSRRSRGVPALQRSGLGSGRRRGSPGLVADPADDMGEGRKVAQLEAVVASNAVMLADRREHLGLLDGVHTEVGLQVKIHIEQIRRIAGQLGHDAHHGVGHPITGGSRRSRRRFGRRLSGRGASAAVAGAGVPVLSRIQPTTWVRVGKSRSLRLSSRATP